MNERTERWAVYAGALVGAYTALFAFHPIAVPLGGVAGVVGVLAVIDRLGIGANNHE